MAGSAAPRCASPGRQARAWTARRRRRRFPQVRSGPPGPRPRGKTTATSTSRPRHGTSATRGRPGDEVMTWRADPPAWPPCPTAAGTRGIRSPTAGNAPGRAPRCRPSWTRPGRWRVTAAPPSRRSGLARAAGQATAQGTRRAARAGDRPPCRVSSAKGPGATSPSSAVRAGRDDKPGPGRVAGSSAVAWGMFTKARRGGHVVPARAGAGDARVLRLRPLAGHPHPDRTPARPAPWWGPVPARSGQALSGRPEGAARPDPARRAGPYAPARGAPAPAGAPLAHAPGRSAPSCGRRLSGPARRVSCGRSASAACRGLRCRGP